MKTILYNQLTNKTVGRIREGTFSGIWNSALSNVPGWLPDHIVELTVVQSEQPDYDPVVQRVSSQWIIDVEEKTYTQQWTVQDIPQNEINYNNALLNWPYPKWEKRIVAPIQLAMHDVGAKMYVWFQLMGFPVERADEQTVHLYCNTILPEHQSIVDELGDAVTIEERPEILSYEDVV